VYKSFLKEEVIFYVHQGCIYLQLGAHIYLENLFGNHYPFFQDS